MGGPHSCSIVGSSPAKSFFQLTSRARFLERLPAPGREERARTSENHVHEEQPLWRRTNNTDSSLSKSFFTATVIHEIDLAVYKRPPVSVGH